MKQPHIITYINIIIERKLIVDASRKDIKQKIGRWVIEVLGFYERNLGIQRSRTSRNKHECEQLKEQKNELISVQLFSKLQVNTQTAIIMIIIYKIKEKSGWPSTYVLGIPRDGTSCCPFVPVQKYFLVSLSFCPGTRAGAKIPGQTLLSRDKITSFYQKVMNISGQP